MALLIATYAVPAAAFGEAIPSAGGLGNDGLFYGSMAARFSHLVTTRAIDSYDVWRALPSGIVWAALRLVDLQPTPHHLVLGFRWLNAAELIAAVFVLGAIARRLQLNPTAHWFAFVGVFGSFFALKWVFYDPVLVDASGFFLAMLLLWAFLAGRKPAVAAITVLGAFTWPWVFVAGLVFLMVPRQVEWAPARRRARLIALGASVATFVGTVVALGVIDRTYKPTTGASEWKGFAALSTVLAAAWVAVGLYPVFVTLLRVRRVRVDLRMVLLGLSIAAAVTGAHAVLSAHPDKFLEHWRAPTATGDVFTFQFWSSINKPAIFLLAHIVFFGPVLIVTVACWPRVVAAARRGGLPLVLMLGAAVVLSVGSESRHDVDLIPLVVIFTAVAVQPRLQPWHVAVLGGFAMLASKVWLPINHGVSFRKQYLMMNEGPFMSGWSYVIQGSAVLAVVGAAALAFGVRRRRRAPTQRQKTVPPSSSSAARSSLSELATWKADRSGAPPPTPGS